MKKRCVAVGMAEAERSFRRVKRCKEMPVLVAGFRRHARGARGSEKIGSSVRKADIIPGLQQRRDILEANAGTVRSRVRGALSGFGD